MSCFFSICTINSAGKIILKYFQEIAPAVKYAENKSDCNIYVSMYLSSEDYGPYKRCTLVPDKRPVAGIVGLWADVDFGKEGHSEKKSYPPTLEQAQDLVTNNDIKPTMIVQSGHGIYPFVLFKEPWIFDDDQERRHAAAMVCRYQDFLRSHFNVYELDSTADLTRFLRLAGTINRKVEDKPVLATVLSGPENNLRYNPSGDIFSTVLPEDVFSGVSSSESEKQIKLSKGISCGNAIKEF